MLVTLIRGARAVVFPSLYEGFRIAGAGGDAARDAGRDIAHLVAPRNRRRRSALRRPATTPTTSRGRSRRSPPTATCAPSCRAVGRTGREILGRALPRARRRALRPAGLGNDHPATPFLLPSPPIGRRGPGGGHAVTCLSHPPAATRRAPHSSPLGRDGTEQR